MLTTLGSISMGLVWGWLLVQIGGRGQRPGRSLLLLGPATLLAAAQHFFLVSWQSLLFFLVAAALSLVLYLSWQHLLRRAAS